jgi:glycerol-3-phosphate acyltransferase PlsX
MTVLNNQTKAGEEITILSVDAMGGDLGPDAVVAGLERAAFKNSRLGFILHGDIDHLKPLVARRTQLAARCSIRDAKRVVSMTDKPSQVMRQGKGTSMWSALESVRDGEAMGCISCGNTGALMALSTIRLRRLPGVNRPAIAVLWPSRSPLGFNVMLDVGADIRLMQKICCSTQ